MKKTNAHLTYLFPTYKYKNKVIVVKNIPNVSEYGTIIQGENPTNKTAHKNVIVATNGLEIFFAIKPVKTTEENTHNTDNITKT